MLAHSPRVKLDQLEGVAKPDGGAAQDPRVMLWWVHFRRMTNAMRAMLGYFTSTAQVWGKNCCFVMDRGGRSVHVHCIL